MTHVKKEALFDINGNRVTDFYDEIDTEKSEKFYLVRNNDKYNFLTPEGKLLSKKWFTKVEPFGPYDKGVRVVLEGKTCLLTDKGKLLKPRVTVRTNLRHGVAIVTNSEGKRNLINTEGKYVSSKWFKSLTLCRNDFFEVDITDNKHNIMTKNGKFLLESDAFQISSYSTDNNKYYVAFCKHGKAPKTIHILDYWTGKEVFSSTLANSYNCVFHNVFDVIFIKNADNKCMLISKETIKPVFKEWKENIEYLGVSGFFAVKENDGTYIICNAEGKKILTKRRFIKVKQAPDWYYCYVEFYKKGKVQTGYLDLTSGYIRKTL